MTATNIRLAQANVRRTLLVQRYGSHLVRQVVGFLNEMVLPDLLGTLSSRLERIRLRGYDSGVESTKRYRELLDAVRTILDDGTEEAHKMLNGNLRAMAKLEGEWARMALQAETPKALDIEFKGLNLNAVQTVVSQPIQGRIMSDWWDSLAAGTQSRIESEIGTGLAIGETVDQMVLRVRGRRENNYEDGALQATRRQAEAIVRTATNHVSTQAREATYAENEDVLKGIQWVSTLDTRTTPICQQLDGKVFDIQDGPRPPAHWNCRSTTVPITKSWRELGIRAREADASTRASMDGQVPDSTRYGEWLADREARDMRPVSAAALE